MSTILIIIVLIFSSAAEGYDVHHRDGSSGIGGILGLLLVVVVVLWLVGGSEARIYPVRDFDVFRHRRRLGAATAKVAASGRLRPLVTDGCPVSAATSSSASAHKMAISRFELSWPPPGQRTPDWNRRQFSLFENRGEVVMLSEELSSSYWRSASLEDG